MNNNYLNEKTKGNMDIGFPIIVGVACLVIIVATIMSITKGQGKGSAKTLQSVSKDLKEGEETGILDFDKQIVGVLKEVNPDNNSITLFDVKKKEDIVVSFTSGTVICDKYEQGIVLEQLKLGEILDAYYNFDSSKLVKLQISNQAWEYKNANNWGIDTIHKIFSIGDNKYKYGRDIYILSNDTFLKPEDLHEKDLLTIKGIDKEIFSIQVEKGHGTITFEEYEDFIGGIVYVGNDAILPITENMVITVREGEYEVTLENGSLAGSKTARVKKDENVLLNMSEYRKPAVKSGLVSFEIIPEGAKLYIDDVIQSYDEPIKLEYGEHTVKVILKGYDTYEDTIVVDEASKTITIDLEVPLDDEDLGDSNGYNSDRTDETDEGEKEEELPGRDGLNSKEGKTISGQLIYILEPEGASVYLDGELKGIAPVSFPKITGNHYVTLIKDGYETKTYTIEATDDGEDTYFNFPEMLKSR